MQVQIMNGMDNNYRLYGSCVHSSFVLSKLASIVYHTKKLKVTSSVTWSIILIIVSLIKLKVTVE